MFLIFSLNFQEWLGDGPPFYHFNSTSLKVISYDLGKNRVVKEMLALKSVSCFVIYKWLLPILDHHVLIASL